MASRASGLGEGCTRRAVLLGAAAAGWALGQGRGRWFASDRKRMADPATDFTLLRLTDPAYASRLPSSGLRAVARSGAFLVYASQRGGSFQVFHMEQASGRQRQLTEARDADPTTPALMPDDRSFCYFDGPSLRRVALKNLHEKELYRIPEGWRRGEGFSLARDGSYAALVETGREGNRLRLVKVSSGRAVTVVQGPDPLAGPALWSRREGVLYRQGEQSLMLVALDGRGARRLALPPGRVGHYAWAPGGKSVFYLHYPAGQKASVLREHRLDAGDDREVAQTSGFVVFSVNEDASVFVGAGSSLAAPYVLLLLRASRRELALCEHRASQPALVAPAFSSDSQRVYFQSDREGQWAIYCVPVERLVEPTPGGGRPVTGRQRPTPAP